ncbi:effector-associated domain 2-containing protein [Streptomyces poriticola]|uniref:effector-associated domain 2-containing protein n=1 Tax=Streptomyces poriticola TaxID=3120506 RepID=UPI002FCE664C
MTTVPDHAELTGRLGPDAAHAVLDWADLNGLSVRLLPSWLPSGTGYTGAVLTALETAPPPRIVILKVLPEGPHRTEPRRHTEALRHSPPGFAGAHLVEQAFAPFPLRTGGALMFQAVAGDGLRDAVPLGALDGEEYARTAAAVVRGTLTEWNRQLTAPVRMPASAFLRGELETAGTAAAALRPWRRRAGLTGSVRPWFEAAGRRLPNPYLLVEGAQPGLPDPELSALTGLTHGDLHPDNVVVPVRRGLLQEHAYRLIDLGGFRADGALSRDVAMLLLSGLLPVLGQPLPEHRRQALLDYVVAPHHGHTGRLPDGAARRVDCVRDTAAEAMGQWREPWRDQLLLSLAAGALAFTTYSGLAPDVRDWYQLLAAHAAGAFLGTETATGTAPVAPVIPATPVVPTAPGAPGARGTQPAEPAPHRPARPRPAPRTALVEALEELPAMTDPVSREAVLRRLPRRLATSVPRSAVLRVELLGLVDTCVTFHGGLRALWEAVSAVDTGTRERDAVFDVLLRMPEFSQSPDDDGA